MAAARTQPLPSINRPMIPRVAGLSCAAEMQTAPVPCISILGSEDADGRHGNISSPTSLFLFDLSTARVVRSASPSNPTRKSAHTCVSLQFLYLSAKLPAVLVTGHRQAVRRADYVRAGHYHLQGWRGARHRSLERLRLRWAALRIRCAPQPRPQRDTTSRLICMTHSYV